MATFDGIEVKTKVELEWVQNLVLENSLNEMNRPYTIGW